MPKDTGSSRGFFIGASVYGQGEVKDITRQYIAREEFSQKTYRYVRESRFAGKTGAFGVEELEWIRGRFAKRFAEHVYRLTSITTDREAGWFLG